MDSKSTSPSVPAASLSGRSKHVPLMVKHNAGAECSANAVIGARVPTNSRRSNETSFHRQLVPASRLPV
eukprot:3941815-Rhodomonas_salina.2